MASTPLVALRMAEDMTERLDELAAARGRTRSDLIREGVELLLAAEQPAGGGRGE